MSTTLFPAPAPVLAAVRGTDAAFPVNRIFCVGRNYEAHAQEMGVKPDKEEPFYFTKSPSTLLASGATMAYPLESENVHYEMELVVALDKPLFRATPETCLDAVYGYACGLDMTRRDLQLRARDKGRPWDLGKDMENGSVLAEIVPVAEAGHLTTGTIQLSVNGETKQKADLSELINNVSEILVHLSRFYHLAPGDLIYTGTPAGVGPVVPGDVMEGSIDGIGSISLTMGARQ